MVSVEAKELTLLTNKARKHATTKVVDMMRGILVLDEVRQRELGNDCGEDGPQGGAIRIQTPQRTSQEGPSRVFMYPSRSQELFGRVEARRNGMMI
jgi:hypothetical protein